MLDRVSKIRFVPDRQNKLLILTYEQNRPTRYVVLEQGKTIEIPKEQVTEIEKPISADEWAEAIAESAEKYRQYIESKSKGSA